MSDNKEPISITFRTIKDTKEKIKRYHEMKAKELGIKLNINQSIELLIADGLKVNGIE